MQKFITVKVSNLKLSDLVGLCSETVTLGLRQMGMLGELASARVVALSSDLAILRARMDINHKSPLTVRIEALDKLRDSDLTETKRNVKAATLSSIPETKAAGDTLMQTLKPFWNITAEPLASQTSEIGIFHSHYDANPDNAAAAATLNLTAVIRNLFDRNDQLEELYGQRLIADALIAGPSAESLKRPVVKAYDAFCTAMVQQLDALPTPSLQMVFDEMNELRRKYVARLPKDLSKGDHCVVEPVDTQKYTEKAITPIPKAYWREDGKPTVELVFAKDFYVTYKNNVNVGTAEVTLHGKGDYKGKKIVTFNIAR
jgi:hypothetical protein